ncbi:MAG: hypothetical protein MJ071_01590 [Oscillospiraceae bacterium]|nr:hypothetical protein [Oscillospiraceae bacterium]
MDTKGISKLDLKRRNRRQILLSIRQNGQLARVDIASQLSLTRAAVTIITNQMISQGILEDMNGPVAEPSNLPKKKGRKKTMIRINPTYKYVLGAVISKNSISVGLSNLAMESVYSTSRGIDEDTPTDEIIAFIVNNCREIMKKHSLVNKQLLGLGIGIIPAYSTKLRGEIKEGVMCYDKLAYLLEMELSIPVMADDAIRLFAQANIDYNNSETANQILVYSGQEYHSMIISGNEVIGGCNKDSASVNRVVVDVNGAEIEGFPKGSVQAELTRPELLKRISAIMGKEMNIDQVNEAYSAGDETVTQFIEGVLDKLAFMLYNYSTMVGATRVTLQDFMLCDKSHEVLQNKINALAGKEDLIKVVYSPIEGDSAFLAGCVLAAEKQFYEMGGLLPSELLSQQ